MEFDLDIRMEMRGVQRMRQVDRLATNGIIFLSSSSIKYPLIATEKTQQFPLPLTF
jgi:hypothetical protein